MTSLPLLIVEDDRDLRDALCITLELAGYTLIAAADGCEALAIMAHERVGLVVSDLQMQPMDGLSLLREIRRSHARVPVILMTAFADVESAVFDLPAKEPVLRESLRYPFGGASLDELQRFGEGNG